MLKLISAVALLFLLNAPLCAQLPGFPDISHPANPANPFNPLNQPAGQSDQHVEDEAADQAKPDPADLAGVALLVVTAFAAVLAVQPLVMLVSRWRRSRTGDDCDYDGVPPEASLIFIAVAWAVVALPTLIVWLIG